MLPRSNGTAPDNRWRRPIVMRRARRQALAAVFQLQVSLYTVFAHERAAQIALRLLWLNHLIVGVRLPQRATPGFEREEKQTKDPVIEESIRRVASIARPPPPAQLLQVFRPTEATRRVYCQGHARDEQQDQYLEQLRHSPSERRNFQASVRYGQVPVVSYRVSVELRATSSQIVRQRRHDGSAFFEPCSSPSSQSPPRTEKNILNKAS
jgi:hypothetical protein